MGKFPELLGTPRKILFFIDQCAAYPKTPNFSTTSKMYCTSQLALDLGIIHAFKCHYRKQLIQKTVAMMDGDYSKMLHK
jgi:hypothetical protein